jgi:hypothetical protein
MSALDLIATAHDETFSGRVMMIMFNVAQQVSTEDPATPDHDVRINYAGRVIRGADQPQLAAAHVISSNPTIAATIESEPELLGSNVPDNDIQFALSSIWTSRAKAYQAT